jgi:serine/threonine protein kinase
MPLAVGTLIGNFQVERPLGRGGMGEVYLATHRVLGRRAALKILPPELAADQAFRDRFLAESRHAASLDHPNIVSVYEAGETDGRLYLAMRYVDGENLEALLERGGRLEPARAVRLLTGIAAALDAAHAIGLVHRDVKPGNILIERPGTPDEHAYLADFGLVKRLDGGAGLTRSGVFLGSAGHVAPEQVEGLPVDGRADVYSLAAVLFHALAGSPPFPRVSEFATLWAHVNAPTPKLAEVRPELSRFDPLIARGMAKPAADRYPTPGALFRDVAAVQAGADVDSTAARQRRVRVRSRTGLAGAAAALAAVLVGGLLIAIRPAGPGASPSPSQAAIASTASPSATTEPSNLPSPSPDGSAPPLRLGLLEPGSYTAHVFDPSITFTVDSGWTLVEEIPQQIHLIDASQPGRNLNIVRFRYAISHTDPNGRARLPGVTTVDDVVAFIEDHTLLDGGPRIEFNYGGMRGYSVDFVPDIPASLDQGGCGVPCIALIWMTEENHRSDRFAVVHGWRYRMSVVGLPGEDGGLLVYITEVPTQAAFDEFAPKSFGVSVTVRLAPQP